MDGDRRSVHLGGVKKIFAALLVTVAFACGGDPETDSVELSQEVEAMNACGPIYDECVENRDPVAWEQACSENRASCNECSVKYSQCYNCKLYPSYCAE